MRKRIVLVIILLLMPVTFVAVDVKAIGQCTISGNAVELDETIGAEGILVTLYSGSTTYDTATTSGSGHYSVTSDPFFGQISVSLKFEKAGYITKVKGFTLYESDTQKIYSPVLSRDSLGEDWGRHPSNFWVQYEAAKILYWEYGWSWQSKSDYDKAEALWEYVTAKWTHDTPFVRKDYDVIKQSPKYQGKCYSSAIVLSGLCRAVGIKARMIMINFVANAGEEHVFVELYLPNAPSGERRDGWVTACADSDGGYGWWGWDGLQAYLDAQPRRFRWDWDHSDGGPLVYTYYIVTQVGWVYEAKSDTLTADNYWAYFDGYEGRFHSGGGTDTYWNTWDDYKNILDQ